ncbi:hypothetical protein DL93DRAFT_2157937 [Clavulina sp. PMI_390]|nr:hypothetical protein DL93DRAFT_2157937 [Clavulina sp. PMI_390]
MISIPQTHFPFGKLASLELTLVGSQSHPLVWKDLAPNLHQCQSLLSLVLLCHFTLIMSEDLILLPRLEALEVNEDCIFKRIIAPNLRCFCHSSSHPFEREVMLEPPRSLIYLRMRPPAEPNSHFFRQSMSQFEHLRVMELTIDLCVLLHPLLNILIETKCDNGGTKPIARFLPNLRFLIVRRSPKDRNGLARKQLHELYDYYRLAVLNLRVRPSLTIYSAELYQLTQSERWVDLAYVPTELHMESSENSTDGSESTTTEPPERYHTLENRIKHIPDDAISPLKKHDDRRVADLLPQAIDTSRALWNHLFASSANGGDLAHPCCDLRINEVWTNQGTPESIE